jgi:general stress protein 26
MDSEEMKMIYVATVKPSGSPHLVPVLSIYHDGKIYFETDRNSVKVKNILKNNKVAAVTLGGYGSRTTVAEGKARIISDAEVTNHTVANLFRMKHPWRPRFGKESAYVLVEITPKKIMKV